jgi:hypothetical protein
MFAAGFDVQVEVDRDARVARPTRVGRVRAITEKIP